MGGFTQEGVVVLTDYVLTGDCLFILPFVDDASIDLILCDLPYGHTQNPWDSTIPMEPLWAEYRRILKPNGVIALTGYGLFSAKLMLAGESIYKYSLVWKKNKVRGHLNAKKQPLRCHEDILIFYDKQPVYNPQKTTGHSPVHAFTSRTSSTNYGKSKEHSGGGSTERYPTSVVAIPVVNNDDPIHTHPTQKPVALGEYLIKTFTNEGAVVLDNACGSGSFLVAAKRLKRHYIGMEFDPFFSAISKKRLAADPCI
jgi:DNA modification methylase